MKNRKPAIIFIICVLLIGIVSLCVIVISDFINRDPEVPLKGNVFLYNPDFNSDIMNEEEYVSLDRTIRFTDGAVTYDIAGDNYVNAANECQVFLVEYIRALVAGDGEKLQSMYSSELIKELEIPKIITEQRIYDCLFSHISIEEVKENGERFYRYEVKVEYKIMRNDGTFRDDLASDSIKPQIFVVDDRADGCVISKVVQFAAN